jgi:hypothetical protein
VSRVYFHSQHADAELRGSERAHLGSLVSALTAGFLRSVYSREVEQLLAVVKPGHYLHQVDRSAVGWLHPWANSFTNALTGSLSGEFLQWKGRDIDPFAVCLNTAMRYGSDPVRLAARIHGQSEIHGWVDGKNRAWLADLMQRGLDEKVYRGGTWYVDRVSDGPAIGQTDRKWSDQGWGDVMALLRSRDDGPVVMSYSVCDQFPNRDAAQWEPPPMPEGWVPDWATGDEGRAEWERDYPEPWQRQDRYRDDSYELWYDLPGEERWRLAMEGLRASDGGLEISPDEFGRYYFTSGLTLPDLLAPDYEERLDRALGFTQEDAEPVPGSDAIAAAVESMRIIEQADREDGDAP